MNRVKLFRLSSFIRFAVCNFRSLTKTKTFESPRFPVPVEPGSTKDTSELSQLICVSAKSFFYANSTREQNPKNKKQELFHFPALYYNLVLVVGVVRYNTELSEARGVAVRRFGKLVSMLFLPSFPSLCALYNLDRGTTTTTSSATVQKLLNP